MTMAVGRKRLIEAALELAAQKRGLNSVGVRELARQADLSANAFYRHFRNMDEVGLAIVEQISLTVRQRLREARQADLDPTHVIRRSLDQAFAFVTTHPRECVFLDCERHGPSAALRDAIAAFLDAVEEELAGDIDRLQLVPMLTRQQIRSLVREIVAHMFQLSQEYVACPAARDRLARRAVRHILMLFLGAIVYYDARLAAEVYPAYKLLLQTPAA